MRFPSSVLRFAPARVRFACRHVGVMMLLAVFASEAKGQSSSASLASRADLKALADQREIAATTGELSTRSQNAMAAAVIRQRLRDGDLQVGDRVVVTILSDAVHRDTVVVKSGRVIELPGMIIVPLAGVLRSEMQERVSTEVLKYVKARQIEVTPLMRVGVLGAVSRPGYFAFASDVQLTDAIMAAGGPTGTADLDRSVVRRRNQQYRSAEETRKAMAGGLTLDQFGLNPGDELVIGQRSDLGASKLLAMAGAVASVLAVFLAANRH